MSMRAVVLSHRGVADELGHVGDWLEDGGFVVERVYREDQPSLPTADLLVVLGSPNSVAEGFCQPPARGEIEAVRQWVTADRPYLGICFGAQVLSCALGGSVRRMPSTFRAFAELDCIAPTISELSGRWAVWHEDAITAPPGSEVLARLPHADAAFRVGRAVGLQPHIEFTSSIVERLATTVKLPDDEWRSLHDDVRANEDDHAARSRRLLDALFDRAVR